VETPGRYELPIWFEPVRISGASAGVSLISGSADTGGAGTCPTLRFRVVSHRREIDSALSRLADGVYGTCLDCGQPIDARRLRALPWAERCHPCQSAAEETDGPDVRDRR
jgi:DksA/TraR C4-type zinc finger protein